MPSARILPAAATAAALALAAAGCGVDTSGTVIGEGGTGTSATAAIPPARSTDPRAQFVHAPSVLALPLRAARLRIGAARFAPEPGVRFGVAGRAPGVVTFAPDEDDGRPVSSQSPMHPQPSSTGQTVALGTATPAIPGRRRPALEELPWRHVAFRDGAVELSGVAWGGDCLKLDHVQVGPAGGAARSVRVWVLDQSFPVEAGCEPDPGTIRVRVGDDWDPSTPVWNEPLETPRPDVRPVRRVPYARVTVQPDRRTVMVTYLRGACEALSRASITVAGRRATVDVRLGAIAPPAGATSALCPSMRSAGTTAVRLPLPLPRRALFVDPPADPAGPAD